MDEQQAGLIQIISDAAQEVFFELGSGHSEAVYETALEIELGLRGIWPCRRQVPCPILYKNKYVVGTGIIDILVDGVIVEIKAISKLTRKEEAQVRKYLTGTDLTTGLLINFPIGAEEAEIWVITNNQYLDE